MIFLLFYIFCVTETCKTTSERGFVNFVAPQTGVECIFPMKLGGKTYLGCVPDEFSCHWCSTKSRSNNNKLIFSVLLNKQLSQLVFLEK